jgi:glycosyltransferase involved in cell wall biosynthesis
MKIAVVSNGANSLLNFRGPLMVEMVRRGHEVLAFAPDHDSRTSRELLAIGVRPVGFSITRSGTGALREFGSIFELTRLFRRHRPDLVFSYFLKPVIYSTIAAWLARVPRRYGLIAGLGFAFTEGESSTGRRRRLLQKAISSAARFASRNIDRLMFQNGDDLADFTARKIVEPNKASLVGATGVDLAQWQPVSMPQGPITFLLAARLLRDKGIAEYAEAARLLRIEQKDARFLLLGSIDDNLASFTRAEIDGWVAEGLVEWPGHVPVRPWIAQCHVFVLPSYYREGVPRSTQEAMAMGRAVITTDLPGCRETIEDGVNGFVVPARDPGALASAMQRFLDKPELASTMGKESRRMAEERFDVHEINKRLLGLMDILQLRTS